MSIGKDFITAGDATFTIECPDGTHHTYRVQYVEPSGRWDESWFVKFLAGPDNESDYMYLGKLNDFTGVVSTTKKSDHLKESFKLRLLNRVLARVWENDQETFEKHGYKLHHEGKCGRCNRKLTTPTSIENGIGPECIKIMAGQHSAMQLVEAF